MKPRIEEKIFVDGSRPEQAVCDHRWSVPVCRLEDGGIWLVLTRSCRCGAASRKRIPIDVRLASA